MRQLRRCSSIEVHQIRNERKIMPLRRRPLARAAMVGGAGYAAGKHRARTQEAEQQAAAQPSRDDTPAPAPSGGGMSEMDRIDALKKLGDLHDTGVLTDEQFEAEKGKLI
jgi:Short C-terminal domain